MGLAFPKIRADWIFVKEKKRKTLDFIKVLFHFHPKSNFVMWCKSSNGFENSIFHFSGVHWTEYWKHQTVWSALCLVGCRPSPPPLSLSFKHKERNIKKEPPYWVHDGCFFMKESDRALNNHALLNRIWKELKMQSTNEKTISLLDWYLCPVG